MFLPYTKNGHFILPNINMEILSYPTLAQYKDGIFSYPMQRWTCRQVTGDPLSDISRVMSNSPDTEILGWGMGMTTFFTDNEP